MSTIDHSSIGTVNVPHSQQHGPQHWILGLICSLVLALFPLTPHPAQAATTLNRLPAITSFTSARFKYLLTASQGTNQHTSYGNGTQVQPDRVSLWSGTSTTAELSHFVRIGSSLNRNDGNGWRRIYDQPVGPTYVATLSNQLDKLQGQASGIVEIGAETIGEVATTHYQISLKRAAIQNFISGAHLLSGEAQNRLSNANYKVDLWIGQTDTRLHQLLVTLTIPTNPPTLQSTLLTYTGFDDPTIAVADLPPIGPGFETSDCPFTVPQGLTINCGYLSVLADRTQPNGPTLRLAIAVVRSPNPNKAPDPFVYLEGGPGGSSLESAVGYIRLFAPLIRNRDLILFDQRGTGFSEPSLSCPEEITFNNQRLNQNRTEPQIEQESTAILTQCRNRLAFEGVDFSVYTSAANAADLNDLRIALGYDQWNLLGISYGTRLALTAMRDTPQGIRSVILDSTYPPQVNLFVDGIVDADRSFRTLFAGCAADPACNAAYPNLNAVFASMVETLNAKPITVQATDPQTGKPTPVLISGDTAVEILFQLLYSTDIIPILPKVINDIHNGDYELLTLGENLSLASNGAVAKGMYFSVECSEELPFTSRNQLIEIGKKYPLLRNAFSNTTSGADSLLATCAAFQPYRAGPIENKPVQSNIPTLVLAGEYDPITPPAWGHLAAQTLPRSFFYQAPSNGHGVSISGPCQIGITAAFLNNPTVAPDGSCLASIGEPNFIISGAPVKLVPLLNAQQGFSSFVPQNWKQLLPGIYARSGLGDEILTQAALPAATGGITALQGRIRAQGFEQVGTLQANGRTWTLYQLAQPQSVRRSDLAVASAPDGTAYVILLTSLVSERDFHYNAVFLPAIDAFTPIGR